MKLKITETNTEALPKGMEISLQNNGNDVMVFDHAACKIVVVLTRSTVLFHGAQGGTILDIEGMARKANSEDAYTRIRFFAE